VGNYSNVPTAIALLSGRPRIAAVSFGLGTAILVAGHVAEGNLPRSVQDIVTHPIWATRADIALANATIKSALKF
jgi:hypothetical protein